MILVPWESPGNTETGVTAHDENQSDDRKESIDSDISNPANHMSSTKQWNLNLLVVRYLRDYDVA